MSNSSRINRFFSKRTNPVTKQSNTDSIQNKPPTNSRYTKKMNSFHNEGTNLDVRNIKTTLNKQKNLNKNNDVLPDAVIAKSETTKKILDALKNSQGNSESNYFKVVLDTLLSLNDEEKQNLDSKEVALTVIDSFSTYATTKLTDIYNIAHIEKEFKTYIEEILLFLKTDTKIIDNLYTNIIFEAEEKLYVMNHDLALAKLLENTSENLVEIKNVIQVLTQYSLDYNKNKFNTVLMDNFYKYAQNIIIKTRNTPEIEELEYKLLNFVDPIFNLIGNSDQIKDKLHQDIESLRDKFANNIIQKDIQKILKSVHKNKDIKDIEKSQNLHQQLIILPNIYKDAICSAILAYFSNKLNSNIDVELVQEHMTSLKEEFEIVLHPLLISLDNNNIYLPIITNAIQQRLELDKNRLMLQSLGYPLDREKAQKIKIAIDSLATNSIEFDKEYVYEKVVDNFLAYVNTSAANTTDYTQIKDIAITYNDIVVPILDHINSNNAIDKIKILKAIDIAKVKIINSYIAQKLEIILNNSYNTETIEEVKAQILEFATDGDDHIKKDIISILDNKFYLFMKQQQEHIENLHDISSIINIFDNTNNQFNNFILPILKSLNANDQKIKNFTSEISRIFNIEEIKKRINNEASNKIVNDIIISMSAISNPTDFDIIKNLIKKNSSLLTKSDKEKINNKIIDQYSLIVDDILTTVSDPAESSDLMDSQVRNYILPALSATEVETEQCIHKLLTIVKEKIKEYRIRTYNSLDFNILTTKDIRQQIKTCTNIIKTNYQIDQKVRGAAVKLLLLIVSRQTTHIDDIQFIFSILDDKKGKNTTPDIDTFYTLAPKQISKSLIYSLKDINRDPITVLDDFKKRTLGLHYKQVSIDKNLISIELEKKFIAYAKSLISKNNKKMDFIESIHEEYIVPILYALETDKSIIDNIFKQLVNIARENSINKSFKEQLIENNEQHTKVCNLFNNISTSFDDIIQREKEQLAVHNEINMAKEKSGKKNITSILKKISSFFKNVIKFSKSNIKPQEIPINKLCDDYLMQINMLNNALLESYQICDNSEYATKIATKTELKNIYTNRLVEQDYNFSYYALTKLIEDNTQMFNEQEMKSIRSAISAILQAIGRYQNEINDNSIKTKLLFEYVLHKTITNIINTREYQQHSNLNHLIISKYKYNITEICLLLQENDNDVPELQSSFAQLDLDVLASEPDSNNITFKRNVKFEKEKRKNIISRNFDRIKEYFGIGEDYEALEENKDKQEVKSILDNISNFLKKHFDIDFSKKDNTRR